MTVSVKRLLERAHAPVVKGTEVVLGPGPAYGGRFSYYDYEHDIIYWIRWPGGKRHVSDLYHELGHAFDHKLLTDKHRQELRILLGRKPRTRWFWGDRSPMDEDRLSEVVEETFADAYARCCIYRFRQIKLRRFLKRVVSGD